MSLHLAPFFSLSDPDAGITADHPIIGWRTIVTTTNIASDTADPLYPVTNLANNATHLKWQAAAIGEESITITTLSADDIDYVAFARHNFWSQRIAVTIEGNDGSGFEEIVPTFFPHSDSPILKRFDRSPFTAIRITFAEGNAAAAMAVLNVGLLTTLPRKVYQGLTPPTFGRVAKVSNGRSESGNFLGRIVSQQFDQTAIPLSLITPYDYRTRVDPFIAASKDTPFFIAWRPGSYPREVAYAFMTNDPMPVNESPHGLVALSLEMTGVV